MIARTVFACLLVQAALTLASAEEIRERIIIAGDSTAADYPPARAPQIGWGQALPYFLDDGVEVINLAVNGRSTKSYIDEGRWSALMAQVRPGDLTLINFGHNDSRDDAPERYAPPMGAYKENLKRFSHDVQNASASPIILSPAARRLWEGPAMVETHGLYRFAAGEAARETQTRFIDLSALSIAYFEHLGPAQTKQDYIWVSRKHWQTGAPETLEDNTHFSYLGACGLAFVIATALRDDAATAGFVRPFGAALAQDVRPQAVHDCAASVERTLAPKSAWAPH